MKNPFEYGSVVGVPAFCDRRNQRGETTISKIFRQYIRRCNLQKVSWGGAHFGLIPAISHFRRPEGEIPELAPWSKIFRTDGP